MKKVIKLKIKIMHFNHNNKYLVMYKTGNQTELDLRTLF